MSLHPALARPAARPAVGGLIAGWRRQRRRSQLDLALEAGISSRHLSFIETGRSRPSRDMVLRLCETLDVPLRARNDLLLAAGFAPAWRETPLEAEEMAGMRGILSAILRQHDPYGAVVLDRGWDVLMASAAYAALANAAAGPAGLPTVEPFRLAARPRLNLLRLLCHPEGARRLLANWEEVAGGVLARVAREVAGDPPDGPRRALLAEVMAEPGVADLLPGLPPDEAPLVVPVEVRREGSPLRLLSTIATLGTAQDITLRELRIEAFYPADAAAEALGRSA